MVHLAVCEEVAVLEVVATGDDFAVVLEEVSVLNVVRNCAECAGECAPCLHLAVGALSNGCSPCVPVDFLEVFDRERHLRDDEVVGCNLYAHVLCC